MKKCINVNFFNLLQLKRINEKKNKKKYQKLQFTWSMTSKMKSNVKMDQKFGISVHFYPRFHFNRVHFNLREIFNNSIKIKKVVKA